MATREKKPSVNRKQNATSPSKDDTSNTDVTVSLPIEPSEDAQIEPKITTVSKTTTSLAKKLAKSAPKKLTKKTIAIKLKPKIKKDVKIKQKMIKMLNPKNAETKKKLLKTIKPRKTKLIKTTDETSPPILEPIQPITDVVQVKKKGKRPPRIDNYAAKKVTEIAETVKRKRVYRRKTKAEVVKTETIEDVMNDLSTLIQSGEAAAASETSKSDVLLKPQKVIKRRKKLNLGTLMKLSPSQRKIIDMLDLNVTKITDIPVTKRRHSIEKFPIGSMDPEPTKLLQPINSPKSKTFPRIRPSLENVGRRSNPYKTRSDSPARILRNGKQRKLKDLELLQGLDITQKRRRRKCSEYSGSELSLSKLSGYESDSSFSDLSSIHGTENIEQKENDSVKVETKENLDNCENAQIKRSLSSEVETNFMDTNSNFCNKENTIANTQIKKEEDLCETPVVTPSSKVPEKSIILDIMKQTFNDTFEDKNEKTKVDNFSTKQSIQDCDNNKSETDPPEEILKTEEIVTDIIETPEASEELENGKLETQPAIVESPENLAIKENILQALGLQSLKAAKEAKLKGRDKVEQKNDLYTGTLKTVIKINRGEKKKGRSNMKMSLHTKTKNKSTESNGTEQASKPVKDGPSTSWKQSGQSSDTAGAHRKSHYSNRSNLDGSSEHTSDGENTTQEGSTKVLVIPEKASSFSIHPGRICKDECSYCFGKFGLFDTPCHIAQMKSVERQNKILSAEKHLTRDSCLCDACYRHVDRKANTPSYTTKSYKRHSAVAPGPRQDHCHVLGCNKAATNILRRKWIIKMRKSICEVINIDLDNPGLHSIPICDEHYTALEHLMVCAMCKRRLAKNHVHYLGPETADLTAALYAEGIPLTLTDKPVVCKLCKYFAAIILKPQIDRPENSSTFFMEYRKRLLHFNDIVPMDEAAAEEPIIIPTKDNKVEKEHLRKKRRTVKNQTSDYDPDQNHVPSTEFETNSRPESPSEYMVDYNTLIPSIAMDCGSDSETKKEKPHKFSRPETVKEAVEISKTMKLKGDSSSDIAVQRLGSNPSISVRQLFPCEEDLPVQGHIDFGNVRERTPEGWEKCTSIIQYDMETKHLWQELQKPYGNQSSFLRHLILLEKYFRNGDLILSPTASHHSVNYSEAVHNRLRAYDNIPASAGNMPSVSLLPFNKSRSSNGLSTNPIAKEAQPLILPNSNVANVPKSTPITLSQLNSPPLIPPTVTTKPKTVGSPPGLISLQPGTNKPVAPLNKPQSQKIKFPITKNWRPNLIPIDPNKKNTGGRKPGLVQVISGGKPYHITLEDYKKMCAIKKSFELKQKRLQEANNAKANKVTYNAVLKSITPRKGLVISKTSTPLMDESSESENILEKLDKQIEKLDCKVNENKPPIALPKIPKSLTVIPQTVSRKPSRPSSPVLLITSKPKQIKS